MKAILLLLLLGFPARTSAQQFPPDTAVVRVSPARPEIFEPSALAPSRLRESVEPQLPPRQAPNVPLRLVLMGVLLATVVWIVAQLVT